MDGLTRREMRRDQLSPSARYILGLRRCWPVLVALIPAIAFFNKRGSIVRHHQSLLYTLTTQHYISMQQHKYITNKQAEQLTYKLTLIRAQQHW